MLVADVRDRETFDISHLTGDGGAFTRATVSTLSKVLWSFCFRLKLAVFLFLDAAVRLIVLAFNFLLKLMCK